MYLGDPTLQYAFGLFCTSVTSQQPKSMTATSLLFSGLCLKRMLLGFKSRWITPLLRMQRQAYRSCRKMGQAVQRGSPLGQRWRYSMSVPPYRSSVMRQMWFWWRMVSSNWTIFRWGLLGDLPRLLRAAISQLSRYRVTSLSILASSMTFMATLLPVGSWRPSKTLPVDPFPRSRLSNIQQCGFIFLG